MTRLDALSELLKVIELEGAVFYNAEFSAPWCFRSPASQAITPYLACNAGHTIVFHLVTDGSAWAQIEGGARVNLDAGDIVIFPHGHPHLMGSGAPTEPVDNGLELKRIMSQGLHLV